MVALSSSTAQGQYKALSSPNPVSVEINWDGIPCNRGGFVVAHVKNISDRAMLLPRGVGYGFGSVLTVRVRSGDIYTSSLSYIHSTPYDWGHMDASMIIALSPGEAGW
jgi:hypothetical protein